MRFLRNGISDSSGSAVRRTGVSEMEGSEGISGSFRLMGIRDIERCGEGVASVLGKGFRCAIRARSYRRSAGHRLRYADDVAVPLRTRLSSMRCETLRS